MQLVQTVVKIVRFHLSQHKANQSIALNVFRNTNPKTEVAQDMGEVAQDMGEVAQDMGEVAQDMGEVAQVVEVAQVGEPWYNEEEDTYETIPAKEGDWLVLRDRWCRVPTEDPELFVISIHDIAARFIQ